MASSGIPSHYQSRWQRYLVVDGYSGDIAITTMLGLGVQGQERHKLQWQYSNARMDSYGDGCKHSVDPHSKSDSDRWVA